MTGDRDDDDRGGATSSRRSGTRILLPARGRVAPTPGPRLSSMIGFRWRLPAIPGVTPGGATLATIGDTHPPSREGSCGSNSRSTLVFHDRLPLATPSDSWGDSWRSDSRGATLGSDSWTGVFPAWTGVFPVRGLDWESFQQPALELPKSATKQGTRLRSSNVRGPRGPLPRLNNPPT